MAPPRPPRHPTTIDNLPSELLSEILIRFPAKPLAQMRSVSKAWYAFLSQPSFIKSHLHRSLHNNNNDEILLVLHSGIIIEELFSVTAHFDRSPHLELPNFIKFPDNPPPDPDNINFFGSVNGLICFGFQIDCADFFIQIWNPSLSAVLTLPPFNRFDWFRVEDFTLELHFRFGYDPKTDDYKLLKLMSCSKSHIPFGLRNLIQTKRSFQNDVKYMVEVEVYSMRKGSWKLIRNRLPSDVRVIIDEEIVCVDGHDHGHLHWLGYSNENWMLQMIVTFDLGLETFGEICLPDSVRGYPFWNGLGVYSGKLCVMSFNKGYESEVWVMNEYGVAESWMKLHVFSPFIIRGDNIDPYGFTSSNKFLFTSFSDHRELYSRFKDHCDLVKCYDPGAKKVNAFKIKARERIYTKIVRYVESLVWVAPEISQIGR